MSAVNSSPNRQGRGGGGVCPELRLKGRYGRLVAVLSTPRPPSGSLSNDLTTMKLVILSSAVLLLNGVSLLSSRAEDEVTILEQARVPDKISDGSPSIPKAVVKPLPDYKIHWSQIRYVNGQKFTINNIEPPVQPLKARLSVEELEQRDKDYQERLKTLKPSGGTFMVFATIYDNQNTLVTFNHEGERYEVWSNLKWNYLGGFASFEGRGKRYDMMLLPTSASIEGIKAEIEQGYEVTLPTIPQLPDLATKGPHYTVIEGDTDNDDAMEFIEAIHDLYAAEKGRLIAAHTERLKNCRIQALKDEELRKNPPPKPDITINFWKRDVVKERQEAAAKAIELEGELR